MPSPGVVNLLPVNRINESGGARRPGSSVLRGGRKARDVLPGAESLPQFSTVCGSGEEMTSQAEVVRDGAIRREEALGMPRGLEALHPLFPLARRLVGVFGAVVEVAVLPMFDTGEDLALGRTVAPQLVGNDHPWSVA
jgi:hypothetical protein